jgi:hypothetical protein
MIRFDLRCRKGHLFEAWFRDGAAAESQIAGHKLACPTCGGVRVEKAPMAPRIGRGKANNESANPAATKEIGAKSALLRKELAELRAKIEASCEYVGDRFAEEARKIHYGEADSRGIYGETSEAEAHALTEEGIEYRKIPWVPRHDS